MSDEAKAVHRGKSAEEVIAWIIDPERRTSHLVRLVAAKHFALDDKLLGHVVRVPEGITSLEVETFIEESLAAIPPENRRRVNPLGREEFNTLLDEFQSTTILGDVRNIGMLEDIVQSILADHARQFAGRGGLPLTIDIRKVDLFTQTYCLERGIKLDTAEWAQRVCRIMTRVAVHIEKEGWELVSGECPSAN